MNKIKLAINTLFFFTFSLVLAAAAAQALPQTYVTMSGSDANPCSFASPCRTFKEALNKADAGGEVIALETGIYGVMNITKAISITAPPGVHAEIAPVANVTGIAIQAGAQDVVVLRGLSISGAGVNRGVDFKTGGELHVENCVIKGFNVGILLGAPSLSYVKDTTIRNVGDGIRVTTASGEAKAFIEHCRLEGYSQGIAAINNAHVVVRDSTLLGLSRDINVTLGGIVAAPTSGPLTTIVVENCLVSNNHFGLLALPTGSGATIDVSQTMISENGVGLYNFGPSSITSFGNNRFARNGFDGSFSLLTPLQ